MSARSISLLTTFTMLTLLVATSHAFQETPPAEKTWEDELKATALQYETTFNAHDSDKLGKMWTEKALFHDRILDTKLSGREELTAAFKSLFESQPGVKIHLDLTSLNKLKDDLVTGEGMVTMYIPEQDPTYNTFTAIYVKEGGNWLIASAQELPPSAPPSAAESLSQLEWLVGQWVADLDAKQTASRGLGAAKIVTTYHFSPTKTFLIRSFALTSEESDAPLIQGTQIIGWDPRAAQIRSWTFSSDGAFGEAFWSKSGDDWLIKSTQTLADGGAASGTYVLTRTDTDVITLSLIGQTVNGEPLPQADPIALTRQSVESAAAQE